MGGGVDWFYLRAKASFDLGAGNIGPNESFRLGACVKEYKNWQKMTGGLKFILVYIHKYGVSDVPCGS